jgi:putative redox protein
VYLRALRSPRFFPTLNYNPLVAKPPTVVDLVWSHDLVLNGTSGKASMTLDSSGLAGPSPVQALGFALAGCMMMDVAYILTRGRLPFRALRAHLLADRAQEEPHRIVKMHLQVTVEGDVASDAVARAIALSHEKYCSVWHSMRQDIVFTTTHDIQP